MCTRAGSILAAKPADRIDRLLKAFEASDRSALARAITAVENREPGYQELLSRIHARTGNALRVGITGPPGAGKSTIVDALTVGWAERGLRVGIIAVDPTSPFTGGALLGDRVRMGALSAFPDVFIRSMATRGSSGGLAGTTRDVVQVMDAFGFDWLLVETVGVGQIEIEVMNVCDSVVVVFVPESGDGVQVLKAGLIEIAHMFVVNKADRPGADLLARELVSVLSVKRMANGWTYPVHTCEAVLGTGIPEIARSIDEHRKFLGAGSRLPDARRKQAKADLEHLLKDRVHTFLHNEPRLTEWLDSLSAQVAAGDLAPHQAADVVWSRMMDTRLSEAKG